MGGKERLQARRVPPSLTLARVPLSAESRRIHGRKPPPRLRLRGCLPNREPARRGGPGPTPEPHPTPVPPGWSLAYPPPPRPVGPSAGGEDPPRGASDLLEEDAPWDRGANPNGKRMGEMWGEGWGRRGASPLGQKALQIQGRVRRPRMKQRLCLLTLLSFFNFHRS